MMPRTLFVLVFLGTAITARAQYFQYSQYNYTAQRVNPALVASSDYASLGLLHRNQSTGGGINLKSSFVSAVYPVISKRTGLRWSGVGLSVMDDRAGGIFNTREASLAYAINAYLTRFQSLSLGFKGLYQQRKINLDGLFTGSQYVPDRGFDETLYNGENLQFLETDFFTFSAGLHWQQSDREGNTLAYWGVSFFDFNKPQDSFSGAESSLNSTVVFNGGIRIYDKEELAFTPDLLFTRSAARNVISMGGTTSYYVKPFPNQVAARIDVITRYALGRSGIVGIQIHRSNFSVGFSYDFPVVRRNIGNTGAFEIGLELRRLVEPGARRSRLAAKKRAPAKQPTPAIISKEDLPEEKPEIADTARQLKPGANLAAALKHKQDSAIASARAGNIQHQPLVIEKITLHFNFEFNSSSLDAESTGYLDDLMVVLNENPHLRIRLTGHTDNVGSVKFNERLSLHRANTIKSYFISHGIDPSRIEADGKGMDEPLNDNRTEEDRAKNRRVELEILYQD